MLHASHIRPFPLSFVLKSCLGVAAVAGALMATSSPSAAQARAPGGFAAGGYHPSGGHGGAAFGANRSFSPGGAGYLSRGAGRADSHGLRHAGSGFQRSVGHFGAGFRGFSHTGRVKFGGFGGYGYGYGHGYGYGERTYQAAGRTSGDVETRPEGPISFDRMPASTGIARAPSSEPLIIRIGGRGARYGTIGNRSHRAGPRVLQVGNAFVGTDRQGVLVAGGSKIIVLR
jgi:hypothetical protein